GCCDVSAGHVRIPMAAEAGQLQLNAFEPIIAYRLLRSIDEMRNACVVLRTRCVVGITANPDQLRKFVEQSIGIATALVPKLAHSPDTQIAKEALQSGRGVYEVVLEKKLLSREQLDQLLNPQSMV